MELIRASEHYVPELALVAEDEGAIVGHIMFSYATLRGDDDRRVLCMAPVSVAPAWQSRGVGGTLVRDGLARCEQRGEPLIVVEGIPAYYPRFGFRRARDYGLEPPNEQVPDAAFMVLPLAAYDGRLRGRVIYPPAFEAAQR